MRERVLTVPKPMGKEAYLRLLGIDAYDYLYLDQREPVITPAGRRLVRYIWQYEMPGRVTGVLVLENDAEKRQYGPCAVNSAGDLYVSWREPAGYRIGKLPAGLLGKQPAGAMPFAPARRW